MRIRVDSGLEAGRNRCQFLLTLPIAMAVGGLYGYELSAAQLVDPLFGIGIGAVGLSTFVYVQLILEPVVVGYFADDSGRFDEVIAFAWDAVIGAAVGLPLFRFLGVAPLPALAAAAGAGFAYGYLAGWVVCGGAVELAIGSITGARQGRPRKSDMSHIQTLEARGEYESARVEYEKVIDAEPKNVAVAARLARLLANHMARPEDGIAVLRKALGDGKTPPQRWAYGVRILADICTTRLGDPALALPDLQALQSHHPDTPEGEWATERIASLESEDD